MLPQRNSLVAAKVNTPAAALRGLGDRAHQQPDGQERQRAGEHQRHRHLPRAAQLQAEGREHREPDEGDQLNHRDTEGHRDPGPHHRRGADRRQA